MPAAAVSDMTDPPLRRRSTLRDIISLKAFFTSRENLPDEMGEGYLKTKLNTSSIIAEQTLQRNVTCTAPYSPSLFAAVSATVSAEYTVDVATAMPRSAERRYERPASAPSAPGRPAWPRRKSRCESTKSFSALWRKHSRRKKFKPSAPLTPPKPGRGIWCARQLGGMPVERQWEWESGSARRDNSLIGTPRHEAMA